MSNSTQHIKLDGEIKSLRDRLNKSENEIYMSTEKAVNILSENNWVVSFLSVDDLKKQNSKSKEEILDYVEKYYTVNNHHNFFMYFDNLIKNFETNSEDRGYLEQLKIIEQLLKDNFRYYIVLLSTAMGILEYKYIQKNGKLNTSVIAHGSEIRENASEKPKSVTDVLERIDISSTYKVLKNYYQKSHFENGINRSEFGRHAVQHGRYNPERYKETDMIKTILLIYAICSS